MPVDVDSIKREFEKVKEAEIEAEEGNAASKAKKENPIKVEKSFAESLQGFKLSVDLDAGDGNSDNDGDGEGDGEGDDGDDHGEGDDGDDHGDDQEEKEDREDEKEEEEEEEDKDSRDDVKVDRRAMSPLKMVSNKILSRYVTQASGPDYEQEVQKRRRAKKKLDRKGKLFPEDGDITDADNEKWWRCHSLLHVHQDFNLSPQPHGRRKYKYDIPVLHIGSDYWAKHRYAAP